MTAPALLELTLTFAFYPDPDLPGVVCAHCLELDIVGQGASQEEARTDLMEAIELYVETKCAYGEVHSLYSPAPEEVWNRASERWHHRLLIRPVPADNKKKKAKAEVSFSPSATQLAFVVGG